MQRRETNDRAHGAMGAAAAARSATATSAWLLLLLMVVAVTPAGGQFPGGARGGGRLGDEPTWWFSAWGGYQWSNQVADPSTSSIWNYDSNWSMRLTAERTVAPRTTAGLAFNYSRLPLSVFGTGVGVNCRPACLGDGTIASYGLLVRSGGGPGLHFIYEGFVGAMQFSNFTVEGIGGAALADVKNTDFAWSLGTGFGYALSRDFALNAVFEYGSNVHERSNDLFQQRTARHYTTRVGLRVGL